MVSTKNTTIYVKEINSENEQRCETQGRQMDNGMYVSWHKRIEPRNTGASMEVFPRWRQKKDKVAQVRFTKQTGTYLVWKLDKELSTHSHQ